MALEGTGAAYAAGLGADGSGQGWKVSPSVHIEPGEEFVMADIVGSGAIQHIWLPGGAFNCYWEMPFASRARITLTNESTEKRMLYYQIDYTLCDVPADAARFCAQYRRVNPLPTGDIVAVLDGVRGRGQYVGTVCAWGVNSGGWWGEGELKFFIDDDGEFPTICGTGTEDYFCGSYNFEVDKAYGRIQYRVRGHAPGAAPRWSGLYRSQQRFGLYRWHLTDPIRFTTGLRVTMQALGWRRGPRYLQLHDDIATVAFWYQTLPVAPFPNLPNVDAREIN